MEHSREESWEAVSNRVSTLVESSVTSLSGRLTELEQALQSQRTTPVETEDTAMNEETWVASEQVIWAELEKVKEQLQDIPRMHELFEKIQQTQQSHEKHLSALRRFSKQVEQHLEHMNKGALPPRQCHQQTTNDGTQGAPQTYVPGASASSSAVPLTYTQMPLPPTISPPPIPTSKDQLSWQPQVSAFPRRSQRNSKPQFSTVIGQVRAGAIRMDITNSEEWAAGDIAVIRNQEAKRVRDVGSLIFETPIQHDYEEGVEVRSLLSSEQLEDVNGRLAVVDTSPATGARVVRFWVDEVPILDESTSGSRTLGSTEQRGMDTPARRTHGVGGSRESPDFGSRRRGLPRPGHTAKGTTSRWSSKFTTEKSTGFLSPPIRAYLSQQGVRQTVNSGYDPQANGLAERWIGIVKVRATALLADVRLPPEYWSYACRWVAYVHTHRVTEIPINKALPHFGDVVVIHHAFKKPPSFENRGSTGVCLGHDTRIAGGVLVVSVINGELKEVCSAKVRKLGERVGQAWRLHVHPQDSSRAAYVNRKGEVRWNLQDLEVPTVEQCVKEDALEVQDIRELGLGWAWFVNDLRAFLPAWQDMELATPPAEEPVTQVAGDVPVEPLPVQADATQLEMELQTYERPLAVTPFGAQEHVPDWQDSHAMSACVPSSHVGHWIRTDLGVRTFQGLGRNAPLREQVVQRLTRDAHTHQILESLPCDVHLQTQLHRRCPPGCGPQTSATRDIQTTFIYRLQPSLQLPCVPFRELSPPFPSGGGGPRSFCHHRLFRYCCGSPHFRKFRKNNGGIPGSKIAQAVKVKLKKISVSRYSMQ